MKFQKITSRMTDITGQSFGKWTVLGFVGVKKKNYMWLCRCSCGKEKEISGPFRKGSSTRCRSCSQKANKMTDITGHSFGEWTVLGFVGVKKKNYMWLCQCSCGKKKEISLGNLKSGASTQCHNCASWAKAFKHGMSHTPIYASWQRVKKDCTARSLKRWKDFNLFHEDVGDPPKGKKFFVKKNRKNSFGVSNYKWAAKAYPRGKGKRRTKTLK